MSTVQVCPMLSTGKDVPQVCIEEKCAWYLKSYKACSSYVVAYNAAMDIKQKQQKN